MKRMSIFDPNIWQADFYRQSPLFSALVPTYQQMSIKPDAWPDLNDYQNLIKSDILNRNQQRIQFVSQSEQCEKFEDYYEPRVFLKGEVQTRLNNWHDFFQVLIWKIFPESKSLINDIHFQSAKQRLKHSPPIKQRTSTENFLTLFDECGIVIISNEPKLFENIVEFQWQQLFLENADLFSNKIDCFVFGHAMYEKALNPYIGMTAHAILLSVEETFFQWPLQQKLAWIDDAVCQWIENQERLKPGLLNPFPLLGVPGWYQGEQDKMFYQNEKYFRTSRRRKSN